MYKKYNRFQNVISIMYLLHRFIMQSTKTHQERNPNLVAVGLDPVIPLRDYKEEIPGGYLPNKYLRMVLTNLDVLSTLIVLDKLEADEWKNKYGSFHSSGHVFIARIVGNDKANKGFNKNEKSKITFQKALWKMSPSLLKILYFTNAIVCDILLAFKDELERVYPTGKGDRWQQYAETNFGPIPTTNEKDVTFRIFIVPEALAHDRNDKANEGLNKNENVKSYVPKGIMGYVFVAAIFH
ncbi:hypothetical protein C2G38_2256088 [Gigaspora rosea]|uniref:Uncharacterized protein n=1 Tax=Gigaspora rosea TaxID=44941 RepID=A0A397TW13_9GLOM|nr:hypothetical protein C2G38_2256088 [Gigaspora rosea]